MAELVTPVSGAETVTRYVWGPDLSQSVQGAGGIGGLLLQEKDDAAGQTKTRLYTYEANGNVGQLVDGTTGAVVAHYEYDPFGTTLTASGTAAAANPFRFSTKYTDDETTLLYYGYRFYSPYLGRWLTRDPIGEEGGVNLYNFALNSPTGVIDPYGLDVYIVQRPLEFLKDDRVEQLRAKVKKNKNKLWFRTILAAKNYSLQDIENILIILEWYQDHTWHCSIVVLDCMDKKKINKLTRSNIAKWGLINRKHTADFNENGVNIPANDWREGTFKMENYLKRVKIVQLTGEHNFCSEDMGCFALEAKDNEVLNAIERNDVPGSQYDIGGKNRFNCCSWASDTLAMAGLHYRNPNPQPFGNTPHMYLSLMELYANRDRYIPFRTPNPKVDIDGQFSNFFDGTIIEELERLFLEQAPLF